MIRSATGLYSALCNALIFLMIAYDQSASPTNSVSELRKSPPVETGGRRLTAKLEKQFYENDASAFGEETFIELIRLIISMHALVLWYGHFHTPTLSCPGIWE